MPEFQPKESMLAKIQRRLSKRQSHISQKRQSQIYPPATEASPKRYRPIEPFSHYKIPIQYPTTNSELPPRASLLGLPAEIRLHIYNHLFSNPPPGSETNNKEAHTQYTRQRLAAIQTDQDLTPGTELLTINRQIHHESLPFLRRSVLLVPRKRTITWLDSHGTLKSKTTNKTLPLCESRLARLDASAFHSLQIKELVIREYIQDLPSTHAACTWELNRSVHRIPLSIETIYLQLCICSGANHPSPSSPSFARNYAGQVAGGIFSIFLSIEKVGRVVVYYCGTRGTRHLLPEHAAELVDAMRSVFNEVVMERRIDGDKDIWWTDTVKSDSVKVARYVMTFPEFEGRQEGKLEVEFWDSFKEMGRSCVLV